MVDTYGETDLFFNLNKIVFVGGSLIKHGGQNPLEPARYGCRVVHGPYVENFKEIYNLLKTLRISKKIISEKSLSKNIAASMNNKTGQNLIILRLVGLKMGIIVMMVPNISSCRLFLGSFNISFGSVCLFCCSHCLCFSCLRLLISNNSAYSCQCLFYRFILF